MILGLKRPAGPGIFQVRFRNFGMPAEPVGPAHLFKVAARVWLTVAQLSFKVARVGKVSTARSGPVIKVLSSSG